MTSRPTQTRLRLVAIGAAAVLTGLLLGPGAASGSPDAQTVHATTVPAPGAGTDASVTVSRTTDLVNQTVLVTWKGFRPTSSTRLDNALGVDTTTDRPVRVYQCRGVDPASSSDCYGAPGFRGIDASAGQPAIPAVPAFTYPDQKNPFDATPDGPANWQDTVTSPAGTGEAAIQVFTRRESAALGCSETVRCSLLVVPNYGRDSAGTGDTEDALDAPWAWARRAVVPLTFQPLEASCAVDGSSVDVEGTPFAARLLASWRAKTCVLPDRPVRLDYTAIGEPQTRDDVASGANDTGLVIDPLDAGAADPASVAYAPVALTSLVVAYQIDDAQGRPVRDLKLDARLVAKLITGSYRTGANAAVAGNPVNLFHDPEFLALNPGVDWPDGAPGNHPLLLGDISDSTAALTRWINADPDARAFLAGSPDPWGMRVNANYKGVALPFDIFPVLDQLQSSTFEPVQGLDSLAQKLSLAQFPGGFSSVENGTTVVTKPPRQSPGSREVIGIIDAASAADFRLSTAELQNAGGAFVGPDQDGVLAGIEHSVVGPDKVTRSVDLTDKDRSIYPLTLLVTSASSLKADKPVRDTVSTFLDYAAGAGQVPGDDVGQLPAGYVPLPADLVQQIRTAQARLAAGYVGPADKPASSKPGATGTGQTGTAAPAAGALAPAAAPAAPAAAPAAAAAAISPAVVAQSATITPQHAGHRLLTLPLLLALGLLAGLAGPLVAALRRVRTAPGWVHR